MPCRRALFKRYYIFRKVRNWIELCIHAFHSLVVELHNFALERREGPSGLFQLERWYVFKEVQHSKTNLSEWRSYKGRPEPEKVARLPMLRGWEHRLFKRWKRDTLSIFQSINHCNACFALAIGVTLGCCSSLFESLPQLWNFRATHKQSHRLLFRSLSTC